MVLCVEQIKYETEAVSWYLLIIFKEQINSQDIN